jgi:hypothetical protein
MEVKVFYQDDIKSIVSELAQLRITIFRDFPYLYAGDIEYEKNYLNTYLKSNRSAVVAVFDRNKLVGASTCLPLLDETENIKIAFRNNHILEDEIYYFGESILLKEYRGKNVGNIFFDEREKAALRFGFYKTAFCGVERSIDHPLRPENYIPLDGFWLKRGYQKNEKLIAEFSWKDIGEKFESKKKMIFWMRDLK